MEYKAFKFEMKESNVEEGTFTGYASVFGNVDHGRDIVDKGAFNQTLKSKRTWPVFYLHDLGWPLGIADLETDGFGLLTHGKINLQVERAADIHKFMLMGAINQMSFGFEVLKADKKVDANGDPIRVIKELKLYEVSVVPFGMNPKADVTDVKMFASMTDDQILRIVKARAAENAAFAEMVRSLTPEPGMPALDVEAVKSLDRYAAMLRRWREEFNN